MRTRCAVLALLVVALIIPGLAVAQDQHKIGISTGYPANIGLLFQGGDRMALRTEFTVSGSSIGSDTSESSSKNVGVAVTALFYVTRHDRLRTYVAPRFDYGYSWSDVTGPTYATGILTTTTIHSTRWGAGGTGLVGGQYAVGDRFTIFGEFGFGYSHTTIPTVSADSTAVANSRSGNAWGTRTGVGVVLYF